MIPEVINNRYKIVKVLAEGGFGKTFLTEDTHLPSGRRCVVKQLKPIADNPQIYKLVQDRFQREAAILEELGSGNNQIPQLYAYFCEQGQFYLVQEYIQGKTLSHKVQTEGLISESDVREICKSLLQVLNYVHSKQIIHRDIKPDNIILRDANGAPVLIDFGAVRESMATIVNSQGYPTSSIVIGTPGFMPPEQAAGRPVYSSDLYSLAVTMIYSLTGKMPQQLPLDSRTGNIIWHEYAANISSGLRMVLDKAIAYNPSDRFPTAREMLDALQLPADASVDPTLAISYNTPTIHTVPPTIAHSSGYPSQNVPPTVISANSGGLSSVPPTTIGSQSRPPENISQTATPGTGSTWVGGGGTFNKSTPVPSEIRGWNWGAFLISPLWCMTNQVWFGLLSCLPVIGLPINLLLGLKGNTWAWRSRPWASVPAFKSHQRGWTIAGLAVTPFWTPIVIIFYIAIFSPMSEPTANNNKSETSQSSINPTASPLPQNYQTGKFQEIEIGNLKNYKFKTGLFSINVPENWTFRDNSKPGEAIVLWQDRAKNGAIIVNIFAQQKQQNQQQLAESLKRVLKSFFSSQKILGSNKLKCNLMAVSKLIGAIQSHRKALRENLQVIVLSSNAVIKFQFSPKLCL